ncbi:4427_t:CDS:2 [Rhizophagus irregularis]|nr:4427_t:CDS:2 [Rhizophagus irregularis]
MDNNPSQNSVNFLDISNDISEFNNYNYYYPNNFQETTNVNQAAIQLSNVSCDNFNCSYEEPNDNIMPVSYVNEQFSSQYTPQYIDQNVNERILDQDSPQYDINYPQKNYHDLPPQNQQYQHFQQQNSSFELNESFNYS